MKLKYELTTMEIDGEKYAVPVNDDDKFRAILHMNETAAEILGCLQKDTDEDRIVRALQEQYEAPEEKLRSGVRKFISSLREKDLLID